MCALAQDRIDLSPLYMDNLLLLDNGRAFGQSQRAGCQRGTNSYESWREHSRLLTNLIAIPDALPLHEHDWRDSFPPSKTLFRSCRFRQSSRMSGRLRHEEQHKECRSEWGIWDDERRLHWQVMLLSQQAVIVTLDNMYWANL